MNRTYFVGMMVEARTPDEALDIGRRSMDDAMFGAFGEDVSVKAADWDDDVEEADRGTFPGHA